MMDKIDDAIIKDTSATNTTIPFGRFVFILFALVVVSAFIFRIVLIIAFVPSESMVPTIEKFNWIVAVQKPKSLSRGEVIVFNGESELLVKRLIGLPGETLFIDENGTVFIDGKELSEEYVVFNRTGASQTFVIPENCVLFLGDNRTDSYDARFWKNPYVEVNEIVAKVVMRKAIYSDDLMTTIKLLRE